MNNVVLEAWKQKVDVVSDIRGGMSDDARETLAKVLNNTNNALNDLRALRGIKNESVCRDVPSSQYSGIDWFPEHSIDMVSAIYASQIIDDIVSVQSIDSPIGVIRFLQYVYGETRGRAVRNDVAIDEWGAMRGVDAGKHVACERIVDEQTRAAANGTVDCYLQRLPVKVENDNRFCDEAYIDLVRQGDNQAYRARKISDDSWKVMPLDSTGREGNAVQNIVFSCDPESGHLILTDNNTPNKVVVTDEATFAVTYFQDLAYCPTDSMNLELRLKTEMIKAVPHKIRANFSFDASYALSKVHGINIEESLVNACTAEIRQERDNEVINILRKQAALTSTWDRTITSYISQAEHDQSFLAELFACASRINYETKRGFGNWVVVGRQGLNIIKSANGRFKAAGGSLPNNGAFVVGTIDDGDLKVIYSPYFPEDEYLVGYKGADNNDAGFIVADFLPITKTDLVMLDDFVGRQGLVSYYGTKMINPKMYVSGKILHSK